METTREQGEVWFLTGSQGLYGAETLRQVAAQSQQIVEALGDTATIPAQVVWKPVLTGADAIRRVCLEANAAAACIGVVAWMHTFSPAKMWIAGLDALRTPLLHLHTQEGPTKTFSVCPRIFVANPPAKVAATTRTPSTRSSGRRS